ncbi:MAG: pirin family protein [Bacteroidetes bacterium]|nr:pirin family protein [Bacteroidota bacterium]
MYILYRADERQNTTGLWGASADTFFASEQERYLGFGTLVQVTHTTLNVNGGNSGMMLHRNMELVDIILSGSVGFQDSFGGSSNFPGNTLQVISAGKGIYQTEFNAGETEAESLRIGFLPNGLNTAPIKTKGLFDLQEHPDALVELVSPNNPASLTVRQQAAVLMGRFDAGKHIGYTLNNSDVGLFVYVINGVAAVQQQVLRRGDALAVSGEEQIMIHTAERSTLLVIEVTINE